MVAETWSIDKKIHLGLLLVTHVIVHQLTIMILFVEYLSLVESIGFLLILI